jgi:hypothetical protein
MTQVSDNNWMEEQDELTFCPGCTEYQITFEEHEKYGCCQHCAGPDNALINDVHVTFLDAPRDAQAYKTALGQLIWVKDITATTYKYVYADEINEGFDVKWTQVGILNNLENLVYRPVDVVESPEEREYFERLTNEQQVDAIAAIVRTCPTNSATGIAHLLVAAGCSIDLTKVQK